MMYFASDKHTTYLDSRDTETLAFATWRFQKYHADIAILETEIGGCALPIDTYDYVVSDSVLEHITNLEATVKTIHDSMKKNGYFYLLFVPQPHPSHLHHQYEHIMKHVGFETSGPI